MERPAPATPDPGLRRHGRWKVETVLFGLFIAAGLGLMVWSGVFWSRGVRLSRGMRTQGTVIELTSAGGRPQTWAPVVRFHDERGRAFTATSPVSSNEPFRVGDEVPVVYNAQDPTDAEIESFGQLWFIPAGMGLVGAVFVVMGAAGILSDRRRRRVI